MQYQHLGVEDREEVERGLWRKESIRSIAKRIGRSHSSLVREVRRNKSPVKGTYTPRLAHERALKQRKSRGRVERLKNERIRSYVVRHLKKRWSPEQIAGRIRIDLKERVSHEAVYQFIYAQIRNGSVVRGGEDLRVYLRRRRKRRIPHGARRFQRVAKPLGRCIDERPAIVERRSRIGDWEGDTVESSNHKPGVNTLVERKTGLVFITKLAGKTSAATVEVVEARFKDVPNNAKHTITLDRGPENSNWKGIETATGMRCFSAHAYHSWERGTNENTNGLIRDYCPKKTDFTLVPDAEIAAVEYALNTRPSKRLKWRTPLEVWSGALQG